MFLYEEKDDLDIFRHVDFIWMEDGGRGVPAVPVMQGWVDVGCMG